jgi:hypothetical protein
LLYTNECTNAEFITGIGNTFQLNPANLNRIDMLSDTLICLAAHNHTVLPLLSPGSPVRDHVLDLASWFFYDQYDTLERRRLGGGEFFCKNLRLILI